MSAVEVAEQIRAIAEGMYPERDQRAAMRGALGDAAALCDALARDIAAENRGRGGKGPVTKLGLHLEAVAKRCGDAIWDMREKVRVPPPPPIDTNEAEGGK